MPVDPTSPIFWPRFTRWPRTTRIFEQCAYRLTSPKPWSTVIMLPYPSSQRTSVTTPAAGASISAPIGAATSIPSCGRARWRMGWTRSRMNALVSHPLVGMIDGVAPMRSRCLESESYASLSERTRMLARRARASTSRRAADAGLLDALVGRVQAREQAQLLLARADLVQRVAQPHHALAHPLDLVRENAVLVLERPAAGDAHPARNGGDAEHQERQRHHAADPDERLDHRLRQLDGAGSSRAVGHQHDGPASLRLLAHRPASTSRRTFPRHAAWVVRVPA